MRIQVCHQFDDGRIEVCDERESVRMTEQARRRWFAELREQYPLPHNAQWLFRQPPTETGETT